jgi:type IV pilus assembly protein PilZ
MAEKEGKERRRAQRISVCWEVDYRSENIYLFASVADISALGIFIQTQDPEPIGARMTLRFSPPGSRRPFELDGEVIWVNPFRPGDPANLNPGMGVRFVNLTPRARRRLEDLVHTLALLDDERTKK